MVKMRSVIVIVDDLLDALLLLPGSRVHWIFSLWLIVESLLLVGHLALPFSVVDHLFGFLDPTKEIGSGTN